MYRSFAIAAVCGLLFAGACTADSTRSDTARVQLKAIGDAVENYRTKTTEYPRTLRELVEGWERPFIYSDLKDPWNQDYVLLRPNCVLSLGPDGELGTEDDVSGQNCSAYMVAGIRSGLRE